MPKMRAKQTPIQTDRWISGALQAAVEGAGVAGVRDGAAAGDLADVCRGDLYDVGVIVSGVGLLVGACSRRKVRRRTDSGDVCVAQEIDGDPKAEIVAA